MKIVRSFLLPSLLALSLASAIPANAAAGTLDPTFGKGGVAEANVEMYDRLSLHDYPLIIFAVCCRNGMQHAFSRMMSRIGSGEYSNPPLSVRRVQRYAAAERFIGAP